MDIQARAHFADDAQKAKIIDWLKKNNSSYYIVLESNANREHIQCFVHNIKYKNLKSFRHSFSTQNGLAGGGNGAYSCSEIRTTVERTIAYFMKEGDFALVAHNILDPVLVEARLKREDFLESNQKLKPKTPTIFQQMVKDLNLEETKIRNDPYDNRESPRASCKYIVAKQMLAWFYKKGKLIPDQSVLRRYINTYLYMCDPIKFEEEYLDAMFQWD